MFIFLYNHFENLAYMYRIYDTFRTLDVHPIGGIFSIGPNVTL